MEQERLPYELLAGWQATVPAIQARPRIVELRAQGYTPQQIAFRLNDEGVSTPSGVGRWHPSTVQRHANPERWAEYMRRYRARHTR